VRRTGSVEKGESEWQIGAQADYTVPWLSPDESKVAVAILSETGSSDIWVLDVMRNTSSRLTVDRTAVVPIWSPDGNYILYTQLARLGDLYQKRSSGAGTEEVLLKTNTVKNPTDWSSDGRFVVYDAVDSKTNTDV
jgi:Tol biopolymer transport system component